jgi:hypothetical protein
MQSVHVTWLTLALWLDFASIEIARIFWLPDIVAD